MKRHLSNYFGASLPFIIMGTPYENSLWAFTLLLSLSMPLEGVNFVQPNPYHEQRQPLLHNVVIPQKETPLIPLTLQASDYLSTYYLRKEIQGFNQELHLGLAQIVKSYLYEAPEKRKKTASTTSSIAPSTCKKCLIILVVCTLCLGIIALIIYWVIKHPSDSSTGTVID